MATAGNGGLIWRSADGPPQGTAPARGGRIDPCGCGIAVVEMDATEMIFPDEVVMVMEDETVITRCREGIEEAGYDLP